MWHTVSVTRRFVALALVLTQGWWSLSSCVSVQTTRQAETSAPGGGVAVRVFADDAARRSGTPVAGAVLGELERREGRTWRPVFRSLAPSWTVAGLTPGTYRLAFPARLDEAGNVVRLSGRPATVRVQAGKVAEVEAVLSHVPGAVVALAAVTVVVAAVFLAKWLDDHDLPLPPPPPPDLVEAVFYLTMEAPPWGWVGIADTANPAVTSHFPAAGAVVAARRPRVIFAMSEPLSPAELEAAGVTVLGEESGLVPGVVSYDEEHWWVVWQPRGELPPGDTFHVTLAADAVEDRSGNELAAPVSFSFRSAP